MSNKKEYKVLNPFAHPLGGRVERGEIVSLTEDEASNFGPTYVQLVTPAPAVDQPEQEKPIDDMELRELKAKAEQLGLSTEGSKADLQERIALAEVPAPTAPEAAPAATETAPAAPADSNVAPSEQAPQ